MSNQKQSLGQYEKPLTEAAESSYTLPSYLYTDADVYEIEKEQIFYRTWQYVAHQSLFEKPGDYVTVHIADQNLFVVMGLDRQLRTFYNVCQHRAHELLPPGRGNIKGAIICPYHAWAYGCDGALRGAPRSNKRPGFDRANFSLKQARLEMFLDCAFINLDPDATPLADIAGDLQADIRARIPYFDKLSAPSEGTLGASRIKAGWKVVVDNYVECYHCDHAHPDFANLIKMDGYRQDTFSQWSRQLAEEIRLDNTAYTLAEQEPVKGSAFWFLWPNTTFNVLPGSEEVNIGSIRPMGLEETDFGGHNLSVTGVFNKARAEYTANVLVPEDIALCESVQRGLKSKGYSQGPIIVDEERSGRSEHAIHHFHRLVQQALDQ